MKIERLMAIIIILLQNKKVTAAMLAQKFNVSKRTIYRDLNDLTLAGIPIISNTGSNGGISLIIRRCEIFLTEALHLSVQWCRLSCRWFAWSFDGHNDYLFVYYDHTKDKLQITYDTVQNLLSFF